MSELKCPCGLRDYMEEEDCRDTLCFVCCPLQKEDDRERLIELLDIIIQPGSKTLGDIADHLIANGVTFVPDNTVGK